MLPPEHGAWGFLFEPMIVGLALAPTAAGWLAAGSALAAFLARNPARIALSDRRIGVRSLRTRNAEKVAISFSFIALILVTLAASLGEVRMLIPLGVALPFALVQQWLESRRRSRELPAEICGTIAVGSIGTVILLAAGASLLLAFSAWLLLTARAVPAVLYVRSRIALDKRGVRAFAAPVLSHTMAVAAGTALLFTPASNVFALVVLTLLLLRCIAGLSPLRRRLHPRRIGVLELFWGVAMVAAVIMGR